MVRKDIAKIEGIDEVDRKILYLLYDDARISYTEIADQVQLTRPAVKNRIHAMEEKGIILGYKPVIKAVPEENGIHFMLSVCAEPQHFLAVADKIAMFKIHRQVYSKTGMNNIVAFGVAANMEAFRSYEKSVYSTIARMDGVMEISLHHFITVYKDVDGGVDYDAARFKPGNGGESTEE